MNNKTIKVSGILYDSVVDGIGFRDVCFIQGCWFNCKGCQNQQTHNPNIGIEYDIYDLAKILGESRNPITISGGDGLTYQIEATFNLVKTLKIKYNKNIWIYTGFKFEELLNNSNKLRTEILKYIDVLVDGKFDESKKDRRCAFKGSTNQRVINVKESLKQNKVVLYTN